MARSGVKTSGQSISRSNPTGISNGGGKKAVIFSSVHKTAISRIGICCRLQDMSSSLYAFIVAEFLVATQPQVFIPSGVLFF